MLSVDDFRKKYPGSTEEQVALYAAAVAAEQARGPLVPEPDIVMPRITVPAVAPSQLPSRVPRFPMTPGLRDVIVYGHQLDVPPIALTTTRPAEQPDLTADIRRIVLGRKLTARERAAAERPDMTGDDLLALLAGVPNAREFEALEGGD